MADQEVVDRPKEEQIIAPGYSFASVTDQIAAVVLTKHTPVFWFATFAAAMGLLLLFLLAVGQLFFLGTGVWGLRNPTFWAWDITNFVWWIGIGHAGTLISAILLLLNQHWRNSINRFAEAMTLFAVACAGMFPASCCSMAVTRRANWLTHGATAPRAPGVYFIEDLSVHADVRSSRERGRGAAREWGRGAPRRPSDFRGREV